MSDGVVLREHILAKVGRWQDRRCVLLVGEPGAGKSVVADQVAARLDAVYLHRCDAQDDATLDPLRFISSLAAALADRHPEFAERLLEVTRPTVRVNVQLDVGTVEQGASVRAILIESLTISDVPARAAYDRVIRNPVELTGPAIRHDLVIVDGLDEALAYQGSGGLLDLLTHAARGTGPRFVITARSGESRITDRLGEPALDLNREETDDLELYIRDRLRSVPAESKDAVVGAILSASNGNFLYARHVLDEIAAPGRYVSNSSLTMLPSSLQQVYRAFLTRELAPDRLAPQWITLFRPILGMLAVARGTRGLPVPLLAAAGNWSPSVLSDALARCGQYLRLSRDADGVDHARVYHRSFLEFLLAEKAFNVFPEEAHGALAGALAAPDWRDWAQGVKSYGLAHFPEHLSRANRHEELSRVATDVTFLAAQARQWPDEPRLNTATLRLALVSAAEIRAPESAAAILLLMVERSPKTDGSIVGVYRQHGLSMALALNDDEDDDVRTLNELLLALDQAEISEIDVAAQIVDKAVSRGPGRLPDDKQPLASLVVARLVAVHSLDRCLDVGAAVLGLQAHQYLVRHLLALGDWNGAITATGQIEDLELRYRTYFALASRLLDSEPFSDTIEFIRSIGESVAPERDPGVHDVHWHVFGEVVRAVALSLIMSGNGAEGRRVLTKARSLHPSAATEPQADELAAEAMWRSMNDDNRNGDRLFAEAEAAIARNRGDSDARDVFAAHAWLFLGKTYYWVGNSNRATFCAESALRLLPPLVSMQDQPFYDSATHLDAFHGPCIQGAYLEVARLATLVSANDIALAAAKDLAGLGAADALECLALLDRSDRSSEALRAEVSRIGSQLLRRLGPRTRQLTAIPLSWEFEEASWLSEMRRQPISELLVTKAIPPRDRLETKELFRADARAAQARKFSPAIDGSAAGTHPLTEEEYAHLLERANEDEASDAFTLMRQADRLDATALADARLGNHERAWEVFEHARHWESRGTGAWEVFQAMAQVPKTTDYFAAEMDAGLAREVRKLCALAVGSSDASDDEGVDYFLSRAFEVVQRISFRNLRSSGAAGIGRIAAATGRLGLIPQIVDLIVTDRGQLLCEVWLDYCCTHTLGDRDRISEEMTAVLRDLSSYPRYAGAACGGLARLFPHAKSDIERALAA